MKPLSAYLTESQKLNESYTDNCIEAVARILAKIDSLPNRVGYRFTRSDMAMSVATELGVARYRPDRNEFVWYRSSLPKQEFIAIVDGAIERCGDALDNIIANRSVANSDSFYWLASQFAETRKELDREWSILSEYWS